MQSLLLLLFFIFLSHGVAIYMARKIRAQVVIKNNEIDVEDLITKVAKAVAKEVAIEFSNRPSPSFTQKSSTFNDSETSVEIDDSIIPMKVDVELIEANIQSKVSVEETVDIDLQKSKSKLASILKKKG